MNLFYCLQFIHYDNIFASYSDYDVSISTSENYQITFNKSDLLVTTNLLNETNFLELESYLNSKSVFFILYFLGLVVNHNFVDVLMKNKNNNLIFILKYYNDVNFHFKSGDKIQFILFGQQVCNFGDIIEVLCRKKSCHYVINFEKY